MFHGTLNISPKSVKIILENRHLTSEYTSMSSLEKFADVKIFMSFIQNQNEQALFTRFLIYVFSQCKTKLYQISHLVDYLPYKNLACRVLQIT